MRRKGKESLGVVLLLGVVVKDILLDIPVGLRPDDKIRAIARTERPGGNVINSAKVLAQNPSLQVEVLVPVGIAQESDKVWIQNTQKRADDTRTVIRYGDSKDLDYKMVFSEEPRRQWKHYSWIHLEGRRDRVRLSAIVAGLKKRISFTAVLSIELEHPDRGFLLSREFLEVDVVLISKAFAIRHLDAKNKIEAVQRFTDRILQLKDQQGTETEDDGDDVKKKISRDLGGEVERPLHRSPCLVVCTWGSAGAAAIFDEKRFALRFLAPSPGTVTAEGQSTVSKGKQDCDHIFDQVVCAEPPSLTQDQILDNVGSGDTFNAVLIHDLTVIRRRKDKIDSVFSSSNFPVATTSSDISARTCTTNINFSSSTSTSTATINNPTQHIVKQVLQHACQVARNKVKQEGFSNLLSSPTTF